MKITKEYLREIIKESIQEVEKKKRLTPSQKQNIDRYQESAKASIMQAGGKIWEMHKQIKKYGVEADNLVELWNRLNSICNEIFGEDLGTPPPGKNPEMPSGRDEYNSLDDRGMGRGVGYLKSMDDR